LARRPVGLDLLPLCNQLQLTACTNNVHKYSTEVSYAGIEQSIEDDIHSFFTNLMIQSLLIDPAFKARVTPKCSSENRKGFSTPNMQVAQHRLQHVRATCDIHDYKYRTVYLERPLQNVDLTQGYLQDLMVSIKTLVSPN